MIHRSPTYRSTVNLNHEKTMKELREAPHRRVVQSMYKPEDKMAYILRHVTHEENRDRSKSAVRSQSFTRIFGQ